MSSKLKLLFAGFVIAAAPVAAIAQNASAGIELLQAVKSRDAAKVSELLQNPATAVLNYRDDKGEGALHVVASRREGDYLGFMLGKGADPNIQTRNGDTPLHLASSIGWVDGVNLLLRTGARVDLANRAGETPLIIAVQQRQADAVKRLLEAGASADKTDNASGRSARDYAKLDRRSAELLRLIETVKPATRKAVAGPKL